MIVVSSAPRTSHLPVSKLIPKAVFLNSGINIELEQQYQQISLSLRCEKGSCIVIQLIKENVKSVKILTESKDYRIVQFPPQRSTHQVLLLILQTPQVLLYFALFQ